ncbi:glycosyltransferase, partial [Thermodesulfobacteriota bacterium]
ADKGFFVGYAGSLSNVYGLKYFIDAARLLQDKEIYFILAGGGQNEHQLKEQASDLSNVIFVGWVPKKELYSFLQHMDITYAGLLNIPSFSIGSDSTKVFEYMKAQRPVVHAIGSKNSVIKASGCGLHVEPEDSEAISDAVLKLYSLSEIERDNMAELGIEYLRNHRTYDVLGKKWLELLES